MKIYLVGGAVRDEIMGVEPKDLDYVVVGATPEEMLNVGYTQVGGDFPVFIHPGTGDEYALARTEFKEGHGYQGFSVSFGPEVTLEDDLSRRDLTINAIAKDLNTGEYIDPYGGIKDIEDKVLKHVSSAFSDDPVRALRVCRFLARYPEFECTTSLLWELGKIYDSKELEHVTPERIWLETEKALHEPKPSRYFKLATELGMFPELEAMKGVNENNRWHPEEDVFTHIMMGLDLAPEFGGGLVTFGVLCHDFGKPEAYAATGGLKSTKHESLGVPLVDAFCDRLKAPTKYRNFGKLCAEYHTHSHISFDMKPKTIYKLLRKFKSVEDLLDFLHVAICDKRGRGKPACDWVYTQPSYLLDCYSQMQSVDTKLISSSMPEGPKVGEAIDRAKIAAVASVDKESYQKPYDECHAEYFRSVQDER